MGENDNKEAYIVFTFSKARLKGLAKKMPSIFSLLYINYFAGFNL